ncbi:hypothetical protein CLOP_g18498 [Closterium sp. NIES-67]|nr:hypothetical protein CLOP_g18498 [Closterium sp. NIES-67]
MSKLASASARVKQVLTDPKVQATKVKAHQVNLSVLREIAMGLSLGIVGGLVWKMHHWNLRRRTEELYAGLETGNLKTVIGDSNTPE